MMQPRLNRKRLLLGSLAALHFSMVICGAAQFSLPEGGVFGEALKVYGSLASVSQSYSYFAPGVGSELQLQVRGTTSAGTEFTEEITAGLNRETAIRIVNIVACLWDEVPGKGMRRSVTASFAGSVFAKRADAKNVSVSLMSFDLPPMRDHRLGVRNTWKTLYTATYAYPEKSQTAALEK